MWNRSNQTSLTVHQKIRKKQENSKTAKLSLFLQKIKADLKFHAIKLASHYIHPKTRQKVTGTSNVQMWTQSG